MCIARGERCWVEREVEHRAGSVVFFLVFARWYGGGCSRRYCRLLAGFATYALVLPAVYVHKRQDEDDRASLGSAGTRA